MYLLKYFDNSGKEEVEFQKGGWDDMEHHLKTRYIDYLNLEDKGGLKWLGKKN